MVGPDNQLLSDGTWDYTYDAEGNVIQKVGVSGGADAGLTWTYGYDNANHMTSAVETQGSTTLVSEVMKYDAESNRVETEYYTSASGTTAVQQFAYLNGNLFAVLDSTGTVQERELFGDQPNQVFGSSNVTNGTSWMLTDRLGSVIAVTNATGSLADTITYDAYGNITAETNPSSVGWMLGYTGAVYDRALGLVYDKARYYDPTIGGWYEQDPEGFAAGDNNLYRYVGNNPVNRTDPSGNDAVDYVPFGIGRKLQAKAEQVTNYASDKLNQAGEAVSETYQQGKQVVGEAAAQTKQYVVEKAKQFTKVAIGAGKFIQGKVEDTYNAGVNAVQYVVEETGKTVAVVGDRVISATKDAAKAFAEQAANFTLGPIKKLWDLLDKVKDFGGQASDLIEAAVGNPKGVVNNLLGGAKIAFEKFFDLKTLAHARSISWASGCSATSSCRSSRSPIRSPAVSVASPSWG